MQLATDAADAVIEGLAHFLEQLEWAMHESTLPHLYEIPLAELKEALVCMHGARQKLVATENEAGEPLAIPTRPREPISDADRERLKTLVTKTSIHLESARQYRTELAETVGELEGGDGQILDLAIAIDSALAVNSERIRQSCLGIMEAQTPELETSV